MVSHTFFSPSSSASGRELTTSPHQLQAGQSVGTSHKAWAEAMTPNATQPCPIKNSTKATMGATMFQAMIRVRMVLFGSTVHEALHRAPWQARDFLLYANVFPELTGCHHAITR